METVYERCCGIDVHKKIIVACLRVGRKHETKEFGASTKDLRELANWLITNECQIAAMESTGSYWKPVYNVLEVLGLEVIVVNAHHNSQMKDYENAIKKLEEMPGIAKRSAEVILAEIGLDMSRFPTAGHLAAWSGLAPGNNESAKKRKNARSRKGNPTLKTTLIQSAKTAKAKKGSFFKAQFDRIAVKRG